MHQKLLEIEKNKERKMSTWQKWKNFVKNKNVIKIGSERDKQQK